MRDSKKNKKVTIRDIAALSGVSRGTVDRVLNNRGRVSPEIEKLVLDISKDMGYKKNLIARNLALNKVRTIAVVIPEPDDDEYWLNVQNGILNNEEFLEPHAIRVSFFKFNILSIESYISHFQKALESETVALLIAPIYLKETLEILDQAGPLDMSIVALNSELKHPSINSFVGPKSFSAGRIIGKIIDLIRRNVSTKILCLTLGHNRENAPHIESKINGIESYFQQHIKKYSVIYEELEAFDSVELMENFCRKIELQHKSFDCIVFTNSRANYFIRQSNYFQEPNNEMITIGFDLTHENIEQLKKNNIDFLLNEEPYRQGKESIIQIANNIIYNHQFEPAKYLPIDIVVSESYGYDEESNVLPMMDSNEPIHK